MLKKKGKCAEGTNFSDRLQVVEEMLTEAGVIDRDLGIFGAV